MAASYERSADLAPPSEGSFGIKNKLSLVLELAWLIVLSVLHILVYPTSWFSAGKSLKGKVALVTGAGRGLGKGLALALAEEGCKVAVVDVHFDNAKATADEICRGGGKAKAYCTNVARIQDVRQLRHDVTKDFGPVDLLVNNAALIYFQSIEQYSEEAITGIVNVNLISHFWMVREFLPAMRERNTGHIVAINSTAAFVGLANNAAYSACKSGLIGFMQSLRDELKGRPGNQIKTTSAFTFFTNTSADYINHWDLRFPPLSIDSVVKATIAGIKKDKVTVTKPWFLYYLLHLRSMLPQYVQDLLSEIIYARILVPSEEAREKLPQTAIIKDLANVTLTNNNHKPINKVLNS